MSNDVQIKISADATQATAGLDRTQKAVSDFKKESESAFSSMAGKFATIFAGAAALGGAKALVDNLGDLNDLSQRLGESVETVQRLSYAASMAGTNVETVAKAFQKSTVNALAAGRGNTELAESFAALGLDAQTFVDLPIEEKLVAIANGYESGGSSAEKLNAIIKVLGESGSQLLPLISSGADAIKNSLADAAVVSATEVNRLDAASDRLSSTFDKLKAKAASMLDALIKGFQYVYLAIGTAATYIANLGDGFDAAADSASAMWTGGKDWIQNGDGTSSGGNNATRNLEAVQAEADAKKKAAEDEKKSVETLAKLKEENDKKQEAARVRELSLAERAYELQERLNDLQAKADTLSMSPNEAEETRGKLLDLKKELAEVEAARDKDFSERSEREMKVLDDLFKATAETAKKRAKAEQDAQREIEDAKIATEEEKLRKLEASNPAFSVDDLRRIGGGLQGVNYQSALSKVDMQKQAVDLQKQTVEHLKNIQRQLEKGDRTDTGDGSFDL